MPLGTILLIILVLLLIGALPTWGYSAAWGHFPQASWVSFWLSF
jgi:hypothetical protein